MLLQILFLVVSGIIFGIGRLRQIQTQLHYPQLFGSVDCWNQYFYDREHLVNGASFNQFRYLFRLSLTWPAPLVQVVHFIAYMSVQGRAPGSIRTYVSGLSYMYKIHGLEDVTKSFIVTKMLEGAAEQV